MKASTVVQLAVVTIYITSCNSTSTPNYSNDSTTNTNKGVPLVTPIDNTPKEPITKWEYSEEEDKMTSKTTKLAYITANELLDFDFPYNGGSTATIVIRKKDGSTDIMLRVSKGQFNSSFDGGYVRIRFDEKPPSKYSFSGASDGSSDVIFINSVKDIISKIKSSKKMRIEAEFYSNGLRQMEFDIEGFIWDR